MTFEKPFAIVLSNLDPVVASSLRGALAQLDSSVKIIELDQENFESHYQELRSCKVLAYFCQKNLESASGLGGVEYLRRKFEGWFAELYVLNKDFDTSPDSLGAMFHAKTLNPELKASQFEELVSQLIKQKSLYSDFCEIFEKLPHAIKTQDASQIRLLFESLLFLDLRFQSVIYRILLALIEGGGQNLVKEIHTRLVHTIGDSWESKLVHSFESLATDEPSRVERSHSIFAGVSWGEMLRFIAYGNLFAKIDLTKDDDGADFDRIFDSYWGHKLVTHYFDRYFKALIDHGDSSEVEHVKDAIAEMEDFSIVYVTLEITADKYIETDEQTSSEEEVAEVSEDPVYKKVDFSELDFVLGEEKSDLYEVKEQLDLAGTVSKVKQAMEERIKKNDDLPEDASFIRRGNWLVFYPDESNLGQFKRYFDELDALNHWVTDSVYEALTVLHTYPIDTIVVPFSNTLTRGGEFLEYLYSLRQDLLPAIVVMTISENAEEEFLKVFPHFKVNVFVEIFRSRTKFENTLIEAHELSHQEDSFNKCLNDCRKGFRSSKSSVFEPNYSKASSRVFEKYNQLESRHGLGVWAKLDLVRIYLSKDDYENAEQIYQELQSGLSFSWEIFLLSCVMAHGKNEFNIEIQKYFDAFWELPDIDSYRCFVFSKMLVHYKRVDYLGEFLVRWKEQESLVMGPEYDFMSYHYYIAHDHSDLALNALYNALAANPFQWEFASALIEELTESYNQHELIDFIEIAQKMNHANAADCSALLASAYYETDQTDKGDDEIRRLLQKDLMNHKARSVVEKYNRQGAIELEE